MRRKILSCTSTFESPEINWSDHCEKNENKNEWNEAENLSIQFWFIVQTKNSQPHSEHPVSKLGVLSGVKKDFRELHIEMGLKTFRPEVDSALNLMKLNEKIGIQNEARILGRKKTEIKAFYRKMWSQLNFDQKID